MKANKCGDLFENNLDSVKNEYKILAKKYHPDIYKGEDSTTLFSKINSLYKRAIYLIEKNTWEISNTLIIKIKSGEILEFKYLSENVFELGDFYICRDKVIYILNNYKYFHNAVKIINSLTYDNQSMKEEFERYMPRIIGTFETDNSKWCLIISKNEDAFLLEDLLKQQGGKLYEKHVAWIISRLINISCYLYTRGLVHNGISLNNCFISPSSHDIMLLGGFWYTTKQGENMIGLQKGIFDILTLKDKTEKISRYRTDIESIKLIGKQLLCDMYLKNTKYKSNPFSDEYKEWLKRISSDNPIIEFKEWNIALDKSWGDRKFIKLEVSEQDIYKY